MRLSLPAWALFVVALPLIIELHGDTICWNSKVANLIVDRGIRIAFAEFEYKNVSLTTIPAPNATATCGCISLVQTEGLIPAGGRGVIKAYMQVGKWAEDHQTIFVSAGNEQHALGINVIVNEWYDVEPHAIVWDYVDRNSVKDIHVRGYNIKNVSATVDGKVSVRKVTTIEDGREFELQLSVKDWTDALYIPLVIQVERDDGFKAESRLQVILRAHSSAMR